jgi:hypothetical protein
MLGTGIEGGSSNNRGSAKTKFIPLPFLSGLQSPTAPPQPPPPQPYLVLRDTLYSCEAYGVRPMYKGEKGS